MNPKSFNLAAIEVSFAQFMFKNLEGASRRSLWLKLATMLGNGVQLLQAIESIRDRRIEAGGAKQPQTIALSEWAKSLNNGVRLSAAMKGWVGKEEMMLIAAGEQSGESESALRATVRMLEAKKEIAAAIYGGLAYPLVLILMAFAVLYLFGFKIVPAFVNVAPGGGWTGAANLMVVVSTFAQQWLWLLMLSICLLVVAFFVSLPYFDGPARIALDRYAPYSIYRIMQGSTWLIATSALVNAGLRIESALEDLAENASPWLENRIQACLAAMRSGLHLGDALARTGYEFPDREIIDDLGVYSALSGVNESLMLLGTEWLNESVVQIRQRMRVIFGVCVLLVGGLVALMVTGMMEMQLQLSQSIQQTMR